jgi:endonuclease/exonuclease/phosphatase family metal-dependent hydrolase
MILRLFKVTALIILTPLILIAAFYFWASTGSYPKDKYNEVVNYKSLPPDKDDTLTVISFNIGYLSGLENAATSDVGVKSTKEFYDHNLETAIAALKSQKADFIGFQEIDIAAKRSYYVNQVTELAKALNLGSAAIGINWDKNYVPFPFLPIEAQFGRTVAGQAILSRYPIKKSDRIVLEKIKSKPFFYKAFYLDRVAQVSEIDVNGKPLIIINVHLEAFEEKTRQNQTQVVKELAEGYATQYPVLLIGDFNSSLNRKEELEPSINLLLKSQYFKSAMSIDQPIATYPSNKPEYTLDYIFYNPERIEVLESTVVTQTAQASDHLPVMMKFRLR